MMHMNKLLLLALLLLLPLAAFADDAEEEPEFEMEIGELRVLTLDRNELSFEPTVVELEGGETNPAVLTASIKSNIEWVLYVSGTAEEWDGPWDKPVSHILYSTGAGYSPLSTGTAEIASGLATSGTDVDINFKVQLDMGVDVPGVYFYRSVRFELAGPQ